MAETKLDAVPSLQPFVAHLKRLGYSNTDQLVGAADVAGEQLAEYLHVDKATLDSMLVQIPRSPKPKGVTVGPPKPRSLGVRLDRIPRPMRALGMAPPPPHPLPAKVSLLAEMAPVRDQGHRGTCVAHASTAAAEHYWRSKGKTVDLSRQFLYWDCKQHDGIPNEEGTWIGVAMPRLQADGCCLEATWHYVMDPIAGNEAQGPPPAGAATEAATYKIPTFQQIPPNSLLDIKSELAQGKCVAFSIPVFNSWYYNDEVTRTGEIVNPIPNELEHGGHAMCFVGYEDLPAETGLGGGRFYLRNSWDSNWATESVLGTTGCGTIPYSYIARFASEAYSIG